jgi:hypothetical protein
MAQTTICGSTWLFYVLPRALYTNRPTQGDEVHSVTLRRIRRENCFRRTGRRQPSGTGLVRLYPSLKSHDAETVTSEKSSKMRTLPWPFSRRPDQGQTKKIQDASTPVRSQDLVSSRPLIACLLPE